MVESPGWLPSWQDLRCLPKCHAGLLQGGLERKAWVVQGKGETVVKVRDQASYSLQVVFPRIRSCFPGATGLCFQQIFPDRQI